jgi:hypothetical protein
VDDGQRSFMPAHVLETVERNIGDHGEVPHRAPAVKHDPVGCSTIPVVVIAAMPLSVTIRDQSATSASPPPVMVAGLEVKRRSTTRRYSQR